jgi:hypothetical protein
VRKAGAALACVVSLACGGGRPAAAPPLPENRIAFVAHDTLRPLVQIPYDQPFAWVEPSRMFKGLYGRDDHPVLAADVSGLRASIRIPLEALGWYEVPEAEARYFVAALVAERTVLQTNYRMKPKAEAGDNPTNWQIDRLSDRPSSGNALPVGRVYRGYAVMSRTGEVYLRVFSGDRYTAESAVGADIIEKVMGRAP